MKNSTPVKLVFVLCLLTQAAWAVIEENSSAFSPLTEVSDSPDLMPSTLTSAGFHGDIENRHRYFLAPFIEFPSHTFLISTNAGRVDSANISQRVQYSPTHSPLLGLRFGMDMYSFSYSRKINLLSQQDKEIYGESKYDDYRMRFDLFKDVLFAEAYYQNYRGFYTDLSGQAGFRTVVNSSASASSEPMTTGSTASSIISRPDIQAQNYGLRLSGKASLLPLLKFFEAFSSDPKIADSSVDTWDMYLSSKIYYNRHALSGDYALVPSAANNAFSPMADLMRVSSNTFGVGAGMGVDYFSSETFNMGFSATLGVGTQRQYVGYADRDATEWVRAIEMNAGMHIDYKGERSNFRTELYMDTLSSKIRDINLDVTSLGINFSYLYRM